MYSGTLYISDKDQRGSAKKKKKKDEEASSAGSPSGSNQHGPSFVFQYFFLFFSSLENFLFFISACISDSCIFVYVSSPLFVGWAYLPAMPSNEVEPASQPHQHPHRLFSSSTHGSCQPLLFFFLFSSASALLSGYVDTLVEFARSWGGSPPGV